MTQFHQWIKRSLLLPSERLFLPRNHRCQPRDLGQGAELRLMSLTKKNTKWLETRKVSKEKLSILMTQMKSPEDSMMTPLFTLRVFTEKHNTSKARRISAKRTNKGRQASRIEFLPEVMTNKWRVTWNTGAVQTYLPQTTFRMQCHQAKTFKIQEPTFRNLINPICNNRLHQQHWLW